MPRVVVRLEADDVGAEHPLQDGLPVGKDSVDLVPVRGGSGRFVSGAQNNVDQGR